MSRKKPRLTLVPAPSGRPEAPARLPPEALEEWRAILAAAEGVVELTPADVGIVAGTALAAAEVRLAEAHLAEEGLVRTLPNGIGAASPWVRIRNDAAHRMASGLHALGLSPRSRATMRIRPEPSAEDPVEAILRQQRERRSGKE